MNANYYYAYIQIREQTLRILSQHIWMRKIA